MGCFLLICSKCGRNVPDDASLCCYCGKKFVMARPKSKRSNGSGTAIKRGSTWTCIVTKGYTEDGKQIRVTKGGFKTKTEALSYAPTLMESKKERLCRSTFKQIYDEWLPWHTTKVKAKTVNCYKAAIKYFDSIWNMPFLEVSPSDMQDCINACEMGIRTRQNMKALASLMYKYAMFKEIITVNKSETLDVGDGKSIHIQALTPSEMAQIASCGLDYADYVIVLCYTGVRPNELFSLKKQAYDEARKCIVTGSKTPAGIDRIITISPKIEHIFKKQMETDGEYMFPCLPSTKKNAPKSGKQMKVHHFEVIFKNLMGQLGIKNRVPYSCRHAFANLLKGVRGSDTDKASLMGHANANMTKYYQEADYESMRAITDAL